MSLVSKLNSKRKLTIAVAMCSQIMIGCGGGGDALTGAAPAPTAVAGGTPAPVGATPAPVGSTPTPAGTAPAPGGTTPAPPTGGTPPAAEPAPTIVASKIDLKTVDGSKKAVSMAIASGDLFTFWDRPGSTNSVFAFPSLNTSTNCELGGTQVVSMTNADAKPSAGDTLQWTQTNCRIKDAEANGYTQSTGTSSFVLESITGDASNPSATLSSVSKFTSQSDISADTTEGGVRYVGSGTLKASGTFTSSHDGKGTATGNDDVDTFSSTTTSALSGTVNGTAFSINATSKANNCVSIGFGSDVGSTRCENAESTVTGTSPTLGGFNFKVVSTTAIVFNSDSEPIAGKLTITQGSETITVEFSVNAAKQAIVTITSSSGATTTLLYRDLEALGESWI